MQLLYHLVNKKRIKDAANELSKPEKNELRKVLEEQKIQQQAAARARKQKMLDLEEIRKRNIKKSDIEIEMDAKNKALNTRADQMKLDDHDDVKDMNKMVA